MKKLGCNTNDDGRYVACIHYTIYISHTQSELLFFFFCFHEIEWFILIYVRFYSKLSGKSILIFPYVNSHVYLLYTHNLYLII